MYSLIYLPLQIVLSINHSHCFQSINGRVLVKYSLGFSSSEGSGRGQCRFCGNKNESNFSGVGELHNKGEERIVFSLYKPCCVAAWFLHDFHMTMHLKTRLFSDVFGLLWRENHLGETANKLFKATKTSALVFDAPSTVDRHACANDINSQPFWTQKSNEKMELVDHF